MTSEQLQPRADVINVLAPTKDPVSMSRVTQAPLAMLLHWEFMFCPGSRRIAIYLTAEISWKCPQGRVVFFILKVRTLLLSVLKNTLICISDLPFVPLTTLSFFLSLLNLVSSKWLSFLPHWSTFEKHKARTNPWGSHWMQLISCPTCNYILNPVSSALSNPFNVCHFDFVFNKTSCSTMSNDLQKSKYIISILLPLSAKFVIPSEKR